MRPVPVYLLSDELLFPPPEGASPEGLVAVGGDFRPERLLLAYRQGIFPWPTEGFPLLWFSPDPRFVLEPTAIRVPRSTRRAARRAEFHVTADRAFGRVIAACAAIPRPGQSGTWITDDLVDGYLALHAEGYAHSVEAWTDAGELAGGLYGVSIGGVFFGESMFSTLPEASKIAFVTLGAELLDRRFAMIDCQVPTDHLARFGAQRWPRSRFLNALDDAVEAPTWRGPWTLRYDPDAAVARISATIRGL